MKIRSSRFHRLDGIRGVAAIGVMAYHLIPNILGGLMGHGYLAVDLFFLLSGFVIAYTYEAKIAGHWPLARFAIARAIRLYPLVIAAIASVVVLRSIYPHVKAPSSDLLQAAFLNALLLPDLIGPVGDRFPIIPPTWSLFFEIVVNLGYAMILPWLGKRTLRSIIIASGVLLTIYVYRAGSVDLLRHHLDAGLIRTIFPFSLGVWGFRNLQRIRAVASLPPNWLTYVAVLGVIGSPRLAVGEWMFEMIAIIVIFPLTTALAIRADSYPASERIERVLGEISYPIYVLHMPMAAYSGVALGWALSGYALSIAAVMTTLIASVAAWKLYDQPVRRWLQIAIDHRPSAPALRAGP